MKKWLLKKFFKKELLEYIRLIQDLNTRISNYKKIIECKNDRITELKGINHHEKHFLR